MAEAKANIKVTQYVPITGISKRDTESYENALFTAMHDLVDKLGYDLIMRTETNNRKGEAWIELEARKKVPNG